MCQHLFLCTYVHSHHTHALVSIHKHTSNSTFILVRPKNFGRGGALEHLHHTCVHDVFIMHVHTYTHTHTYTCVYRHTYTHVNVTHFHTYDMCFVFSLTHVQSIMINTKCAGGVVTPCPNVTIPKFSYVYQCMSQDYVHVHRRHDREEVIVIPPPLFILVCMCRGKGDVPFLS